MHIISVSALRDMHTCILVLGYPYGLATNNICGDLAKGNLGRICHGVVSVIIVRYVSTRFVNRIDQSHVGFDYINVDWTIDICHEALSTIFGLAK